MTANQAIILLKIYRDCDVLEGEPQAKVIIKQFKDGGLIEPVFMDGSKIIRSPEGDRWATTITGGEVVRW